MNSEHFEKLIDSSPLSGSGARGLLASILDSSAHPSGIAATLGLLRMRSLSAEELLGFRDELMERAVAVSLGEFETLDIVGTGGDRKGSINLSTLSAFVVAGCGVPVAKHGNYGATSRSGASTVLEALGVRFSADSGFLRQCLERAGLCYLHAPLFHPCLKFIAPVRRELPFLTLFNILGPLCNPAKTCAAVIGVSQSQVARLYSQVVNRLFQRFSIVHSLDGFDELSLTAPCRVFGQAGEQIVSAQDFSLTPLTASVLRAEGDSSQIAKHFYELLRGRGGISERSQLQREAIIAGAAVGLKTYYPDLSLIAAAVRARESLCSGRAFHVLEALRELSERL